MEARKEPARVCPDEWGFFDPDKAGLAAVLRRLDARSVAGDGATRVVAAAREPEPRIKG
jgi:hypothetical protein